MDSKQQYLTYAVLGKPRVCLLGAPLYDVRAPESGRRQGGRSVMRKLQDAAGLRTRQLRAWLVRVRGVRPQLTGNARSEVAGAAVTRSRYAGELNWLVSAISALILLGSIGWWAGEWFKDYNQSVTEKLALFGESVQHSQARVDPSPAAADLERPMLPMGAATPSSLEAEQHEVIRLVDEPAMPALAAVPAAAMPQNAPKVGQPLVMPLPLPSSVPMSRSSATKLDLEPVERPQREVVATTKPTKEEPARAVVLDASKPAVERDRQEKPEQASPVKVASSVPAIQAPPPGAAPGETPSATKSSTASLAVQPSINKAAPTPASVVAAPTTAGKKPFAEPIDVTDQPRGAKQNPGGATPASSAAPGGTVTVVDIAPDGAFALITNPANRLPQRYVVGDKIYTGETIKKIDSVQGRVVLDRRTVAME